MMSWISINPPKVLPLMTNFRQISPMPRVRNAQIHMPDLYEAVQRAGNAWSETQMADALRSVRFFIEQAEKTLNAPG